MYPQLPSGFVFGASTASYQIEGAVDADGRGPSVWDAFAAEPGRISDGSSGAVACDHYHRWEEDVALMERLGLGGYRFSIAWPRIQPTGSGAANTAGLDFYDRLVDGLLAAGVAPMATLYHWDLPQALQERGGWMVRETVDRFEEYAVLVAERLADRVAYWCPVNEPNVVTWLGHGMGVHAPGLTEGLGALPVAHHLMLAHGVAVRALRAAGAQAIGSANNHAPVWVAGGADASEEDRVAAERYDTVWNRIFADPIMLGRYPEEHPELVPTPQDGVLDGDLELISAPLDFYGLNYYSPTLVGAVGRDDQATRSPRFEGMPFSVLDIDGYPVTDFDWPVVPDGLREVLVGLHSRYPDLPPVHITENGCAWAQTPDDQFRVDYLDAHLRAVGEAIEQGVGVAGYWTWSLLDNFEWAEGFTKRFGLIHVDYDTGRRTPRRSFEWYAETIRAQAPAG